MALTRFVLIFAGLLGPLALIARPALAGPAQDAVLAADDARAAALIAADRPALERTLAAELRYVHSNGLVQDRAEYLEATLGGTMKYSSITPVSREVRLLGTAALLTGSNRVAVTLNDKPLQLDILYTAVYVQEGTNWKLTAWQSTPAQQLPKP